LGEALTVVAVALRVVVPATVLTLGVLGPLAPGGAAWPPLSSEVSVVPFDGAEVFPAPEVLSEIVADILSPALTVPHPWVPVVLQPVVIGCSAKSWADVVHHAE
jgi:hypothetical protein